jgi:hypothetical protein
MPSLPPHHDFRRKVRAKEYQVVERRQNLKFT